MAWRSPGEDPSEQLALAKLACDVGEEHLIELCAAVSGLIDMAGEGFPQPEGRRFALGARIVVFALSGRANAAGAASAGRPAAD